MDLPQLADLRFDNNAFIHTESLTMSSLMIASNCSFDLPNLVSFNITGCAFSFIQKVTVTSMNYLMLSKDVPFKKGKFSFNHDSFLCLSSSHVVSDTGTFFNSPLSLVSERFRGIIASLARG